MTLFDIITRTWYKFNPPSPSRRRRQHDRERAAAAAFHIHPAAADTDEASKVSPTRFACLSGPTPSVAPVRSRCLHFRRQFRPDYPRKWAILRMD
jgi:hypothetical protein